jgi:hypothetical protein
VSWHHQQQKRQAMTGLSLLEGESPGASALMSPRLDRVERELRLAELSALREDSQNSSVDLAFGEVKGTVEARRSRLQHSS